MKIKIEHYEHMRNAIRATVTPDALRAHAESLRCDARVKDLDKRLRWDCLYAAKLSAWLCATLYPYADDSHVDTALRAIMREVY